MDQGIRVTWFYKLKSQFSTNFCILFKQKTTKTSLKGGNIHFIPCHFHITSHHHTPSRVITQHLQRIASRRATQIVAALINTPPMMALNVGTSLNSSQPITADHTRSKNLSDCVAEMSAF